MGSHNIISEYWVNFATLTLLTVYFMLSDATNAFHKMQFSDQGCQKTMVSVEWDHMWGIFSWNNFSFIPFWNNSLLWHPLYQILWIFCRSIDCLKDRADKVHICCCFKQARGSSAHNICVASTKSVVDVACIPHCLLNKLFLMPTMLSSTEFSFYFGARLDQNWWWHNNWVFLLSSIVFWRWNAAVVDGEEDSVLVASSYCKAK